MEEYGNMNCAVEKKNPAPECRAYRNFRNDHLRQYRTNELVRWRVNFSTDSLAEIEGLLVSV